MSHTVQDLTAAMPDALRPAFGHPARSPHPLAESLNDRPMATSALILGRQTPAGRNPSADDRQVIARGLRTADFGNLMSEALAPVIATQFAAAAEHRKFCRLIEVPSYRPTRVPSAIASNIELPELTESAELSAFDVVTQDGIMTRLKRYGAVLAITEEAVVNDKNAAIAAMVEQMASAAARREAQAVYAAMESDSPLADNELPFSTDHGNIVAAALDPASLAQAVAALRMQRTLSGNVTDLAASHLVVAPDLEFSAKKMLHESGLSQPIAVTASGLLPAARWYLLCDPAIQPTIAALTLKGSNGMPIVLGPDQSPIELDGLVLRVTAAVGGAMLSRTGIVRGGV